MLLFLRKKSNQKSRPKTNTARFREGALIKLQDYCNFSIDYQPTEYLANTELFN